jgi:hypothetical protein
MSKKIGASIGGPLILFVVGGSMGLSVFIQGQVEAKDTRYKSQSRRQYTLEEEHKVSLTPWNCSLKQPKQHCKRCYLLECDGKIEHRHL